MDHKSFILYGQSEELIDMLNDEDCGKLMRALFVYARTKDQPELPPSAKIVFTAMRQYIDENEKKWNEEHERRIRAGKLSAKNRRTKRTADDEDGDGDDSDGEPAGSFDAEMFCDGEISEKETMFGDRMAVPDADIDDGMDDSIDAGVDDGMDNGIDADIDNGTDNRTDIARNQPDRDFVRGDENDPDFAFFMMVADAEEWDMYCQAAGIENDENAEEQAQTEQALQDITEQCKAMLNNALQSTAMSTVYGSDSESESVSVSDSAPVSVSVSVSVSDFVSAPAPASVSDSVSAPALAPAPAPARAWAPDEPEPTEVIPLPTEPPEDFAFGDRMEPELLEPERLASERFEPEPMEPGSRETGTDFWGKSRAGAEPGEEIPFFFGDDDEHMNPRSLSERYEDAKQKSYTRTDSAKNGFSQPVRSYADRKMNLPPSYDEVAAYCREQRLYTDPARFHRIHEANGWTVNGSPMRDWRAVLRRWSETDRRRAQRSGASADSGYPNPSGASSAYSPSDSGAAVSSQRAAEDAHAAEIARMVELAMQIPFDERR